MLSGVIERYSITPSAGQRRAVAVNLVVFFIFALTAVLMLTRTAIAANSINRSVASTIEPAVGGISQETSQLRTLDVTVRMTGRIAEAAKPLSRQLDSVVAATDHINDNLASTLESVKGIGLSVDGIKQSTGEIRPAVGVLDGHVDVIHNEAVGIAGGLSRVAGLSDSMVRNLSGTNASLARILGATGPLQTEVREIRALVPQINARAASIALSPVLLRKPLELAPLLGDLLGGS